MVNWFKCTSIIEVQFYLSENMIKFILEFDKILLRCNLVKGKLNKNFIKFQQFFLSSKLRFVQKVKGSLILIAFLVRCYGGFPPKLSPSSSNNGGSSSSLGVISSRAYLEVELADVLADAVR